MAAGSLRPPALVALTLTLTLAAAPASGLANRAADASLSLEVVAQPVAYAGYPIVVGVSSDGLPNRTAVTVELDGKNVATATVFRGQGEATVAVPLGRHRLVARAVLGDEQVASRPRAIAVVPARTWQTAGDNGRYAGTAGGGPVSFEVTGGGRDDPRLLRSRFDVLRRGDDRAEPRPDRLRPGLTREDRAGRALRHRSRTRARTRPST